MNVVIIDDEKRSRNVLRTLIEDQCPKILQVFEASNLLDGVEIIKEHEPSLIFLDIEMPEHSGLEILDFIDKNQYDFEIVFTTAYSDYAIQAFQLAAIDYLLKPIQLEQFKNAINKAIKLLGNNKIEERLAELKSSLNNAEFKKIALPHADGITFIEFEEIIVLKASSMYTEIFTKNHGKLIVSKPLKHFATILEKFHIFYRPHRSYLINLKNIKEYVRKDGGYIILDNNMGIPVSKDKKEEFLSLVQSL